MRTNATVDGGWATHLKNMPASQIATCPQGSGEKYKQTLLTFHYTPWFMEILMMASYDPLFPNQNIKDSCAHFFINYIFLFTADCLDVNFAMTQRALWRTKNTPQAEFFSSPDEVDWLSLISLTNNHLICFGPFRAGNPSGFGGCKNANNLNKYENQQMGIYFFQSRGRPSTNTWWGTLVWFVWLTSAARIQWCSYLMLENLEVFSKKQLFEYDLI